MAKKRKKKVAEAAPAPEPEQKPVVAAAPVPKVVDRTRTEEYFGLRGVVPIKNSEIVLERLQLVPMGGAPQNCKKIFTTAGKELGVLARLPMKKIWKLAFDRSGGSPLKTYGITDKEWSVVYSALAGYVIKHNMKSIRNGPVLLQDVWMIRELDFVELFLPKAKCAVKVMRAAAEADIEESRQVAARWKKIKHYPHKVSLSEASGGIFSAADVKKLNDNGIATLNDIREKDIYFLKNLFLDHDMGQLPEEINAAFKEDHERRKDFRYQFWPTLLGVCASLVTSIIGFIFQYTLLKNQEMTLTIFAMLALWAVTVGLIIGGACRARKRRKKRETYRYFSKPMRFAFAGFVMVSLMSLTSASVFYERYDGYDDTYFYRNLGDDKITIANLFDGDAENLRIPTSIDGKTVTAISSGAFYGTKAVSAVIPDTVTEIGSSAFQWCQQLVSVQLPDTVTELPYAGFADCASLAKFEISDVITKVGDYAFTNTALTAMTIPESVTYLGNGVFKSCAALGSVTIEGAPSYIGDSAFEGCSLLRSVTCDDLSNLKEVRPYTFAECVMLSSTNLFENAETVGKEALRGCGTLTEFVLPAATRLESGIFNRCVSLEKITIPFLGETREKEGSWNYLFDDQTPIRSLTLTNATLIGANAFSGLTEITTINLPETVETIGTGAFRDCTSLSTITLPAAITEIKEETFKNCEALQAIEIPSGITAIGKRAFAESGLNILECPASVVSVGERAFELCDNLTRVTFNGPLSSLGQNAFENCAALTAVTCGDTSDLKRIEAYTFERCAMLRTTNLFENAEFIGKGALENCTSLAEFSLPAAQQIEGDVFKGCTSLETLSVPFIGYNRDAENGYGYLFDDQTPIRSLTVTNATKIGKWAFAKQPTLRTVVISDTVQTIGQGAFSECPQLTSVRLPAGVTRIEGDTFKDSTSLRTVTGATSAEFIGRSAFQGCTALEGVDAIPGAVTIEPYAFSGCNALRNVQFTSATKTIGEYAFENTGFKTIDLSAFTGTAFGNYAFQKCYEATSFVLPSTMERVPEGLFNECRSLRQFNLPASVHTIGKNAFRSTDIATLNLPANVTKIENGAFYGCGFSRLLIPSTVETIEEDAFAACESLTYFEGYFLGYSRENTNNGYAHLFGDNGGLVTTIILRGMQNVKGSVFGGGERILSAVSLPETVTLEDGVFKNFVALEEVMLNPAMTLIGNSVFQGCTALETIELPTALSRIGNDAFGGCSDLSEIGFPATLTEIGGSAFSGCTSLTSVVVPNSVTKMGSNVFKSCGSLRELTLPFLGETRTNAAKLDYVTDSYRSLRVVVLTNASILEERAFTGFVVLNDVTLNAGITTVKKEVFYECDNLSVVRAPRSVANYIDLPSGAYFEYTD